VIFVLRNHELTAADVDVRIVHARTHSTREQRDLFCVGSEELIERLRDAGCVIVALHDGWHPDENGGGVAVWGDGRYWEVRSSPFEVVDQG
jgi:hypothetical protein